MRIDPEWKVVTDQTRLSKGTLKAVKSRRMPARYGQLLVRFRTHLTHLSSYPLDTLNTRVVSVV